MPVTIKGSKVATTLEAASKIIWVLLAATSAGLGVYYGLEGRVTNLEAYARRLEGRLEEHRDSGRHDSWFGSDRILHPALRRLLEDYVQECSRADHAEFVPRHEIEDCLQRIFELNPELSRPGCVR